MKGQMMVGSGLETAETERTRKMGATWSATQVGLRRVKAGLGGHDDGVSGVDEGVEETSIPISKRGRMALSEYPTFSGFWAVGSETDSAMQNHFEETASPDIKINLFFLSYVFAVTFR